ncbi:YfaQ family protein [Pseudoduganella ginsengisoli]|uniref:DUF2300 domain-containing protein n=1 Tax=Pseudoduganella ginsengisoli TaxID=1462440 RepID=A0A6L6Q9F7_9BURK|nr:DUF2300 domain-containing protein [Pseudoduganella ginsengisoli]MTW06275.1 DUF2300 domain-containing protein [Pseudoduganella ginsengisoli]
MNKLQAALLGTVVACAAAAPCAAASLNVAWWKGDRTVVTQLRNGGPAPAPFNGSRMVPLGSLWKLFVYLYAAETKTPLPDYRCTGRDPDEVYCCDAGQSVNRDAALVQSCGLFFAPARLALAIAPWQTYWTRRLGAAPGGDTAWLAAPSQLSPERMVRLDSLLRVLAAIPPASRAEAEHALLRVVLDGRGADSVRWFGSRLRVKTFSWHEGKERLGGAAGWLADGTPVWFAGQGTSSSVFRAWAPQLAAALPPAEPDDSGCVVVDYFARYPLRAVQGDGGAAAPGPLHGRYRVTFENGQALALRSTGEMVLEQQADGRLKLRGRFGTNEYVARVIDREASAEPAEAARALAVSARSYLQQNARQVAGCQQITDSSATQRVSPNPASAAALAAARWTDQLVVDGTPVRYHRDTPSADTLAWTRAVALARQGRYFDEVLADAYPHGVLAAAGTGGVRCTRLAQNEAWLERELPRWQRVLRQEAGYEAPANLPAVCALASGAPYSEQSRNRIFMRPLATREDRITLAHEYLHLGLRHHPRGQDEDYVERLARRLTDLKLEAL